MIDKTSKIFVTGGTGFVGSYILRELKSQGYKHIYALKRQHSTVSPDLVEGIHWLEGDILDVPTTYDQLSAMDAVIHAAADVGFSLRRRQQILSVSRDGTATLINAALASDVKKFVHVSSVAAIGRQKVEEDIHEKKIFSHSVFDTSYGLAKFLAEQEVWRGQAEGLNVAIINPSLIIGSKQFDRSSQKIFSKIAHQKMPYYPTGSTGWVDVRDVASAAAKCLSNEIMGERFIISSSNMAYRDGFELIASQLQVPFKAKPLTPVMGKIACYIEAFKSWLTGKDPLLTHETLNSMSCRSNYDNTKSINGLQMEYRDVQDTIVEACQNYKNQM
jgi:dihydroflavonol-4-reductase